MICIACTRVRKCVWKMTYLRVGLRKGQKQFRDEIRTYVTVRNQDQCSLLTNLQILVCTTVMNHLSVGRFDFL